MDWNLNTGYWALGDGNPGENSDCKGPNAR